MNALCVEPLFDDTEEMYSPCGLTEGEHCLEGIACRCARVHSHAFTKAPLPASDERVAEVREALKGMTPGPWGREQAIAAQTEADVQGIALLRNAVPELLARIEGSPRKRREWPRVPLHCDACKDECGDCRCHWSDFDAWLAYERDRGSKIQRLPARAGWNANSAFSAHLWREQNERITALQRSVNDPIPLILHCPACHLQHVDVDDESGKWATERVHRTHRCLGCQHEWRPANRYTVGVRELPEEES
jgi:hypothetical protein